MNKSADNYFIEGCGRCALGGTPACKVHTWEAELALLRSLILESGLEEESKWGMPCYSLKGKNVILLSAFKAYCSINFFKGVLLNDESGVLVKPGENSQSVRLLKFTSVEEIKAIVADIKEYIYEAIEVEKANLKVEFKKNPELKS